MDLSNFFSAAEGRLDRWRTLHRIAKAFAGAGGGNTANLRQEAQKLLADMGPIEDFCGYPGPRLMAQLPERLQTSDWSGFARLVQRISNALLTNSYRESSDAWKAEEETEPRPTDILPPSIGRGQSRKPYFEVLMVSPGERSMWPEIREVFRRLRRVEDPFVYEPVIVGSFEDAVLAIVFNPNLQAVVISDGFGFPSQYNVPVLREILTKQVQIEERPRSATKDLGTTLARMIRRWRPEVDVYLTTDRDIGTLAGSDEAVADPAGLLRHRRDDGNPPGDSRRGQRPLRNPLLLQPEKIRQKAYRHLPCPTRGPGEVDLQVELDPRHGRFLWRQPLPGRIVGNHRRPRQPARTDRQHQSGPGEGRARLGRRRELIFVTNGTSTVQQDRASRRSAGPAISCWSTATATSPTTTDSSWPAPSRCTLRLSHGGQYSMYGGGAAPVDQEGPAATSRPKGSSTEPRSSTSPTAPLTATCTTRGGSWRSAWPSSPTSSSSGTRRGSGSRPTPFSIAGGPPWGRRDSWRPGTATPPTGRNTRPSRPRPGTSTRRMRNSWTCTCCPTRTRCASGFTRPNSTHKSMSALRQGSMILVYDQDFHLVEESFGEAFLAHTSTSPNLQIIASLDVARRQMELEGYKLVMRSIRAVPARSGSR